MNRGRIFAVGKLQLLADSYVHNVTLRCHCPQFKIDRAAAHSHSSLSWTGEVSDWPETQSYRWIIYYCTTTTAMLEENASVMVQSRGHLLRPFLENI